MVEPVLFGTVSLYIYITVSLTRLAYCCLWWDKHAFFVKDAQEQQRAAAGPALSNQRPNAWVLHPGVSNGACVPRHGLPGVLYRRHSLPGVFYRRHDLPGVLYRRLQGKFQLLPPAPRTTPFPEETSILGVIHDFLL